MQDIMKNNMERYPYFVIRVIVLKDITSGSQVARTRKTWYRLLIDFLSIWFYPIRRFDKGVNLLTSKNHREEKAMITITDEFMRQMMSTVKNYCIVLLTAGPNRHVDGVEKIIWEHGRRNFALHAEGVLSIVCPISDGSDVAGVGIFNASLEEVKKIMDEDPCVKAGVLVCEVHTCRSFPGDSLPG